MKQGSETAGSARVQVCFKKKINLKFDAAKCVSMILDAEKNTNCVINVVFAGDGLLKMINTEYRQKNRTTDVISFEPVMGPDKVPAADIYISVDMAAKNADDFGVTVNEETARLLTHGTLHVLGYDHLNTADEKKMMKATEKYMKFFLREKPGQDKKKKRSK